jgi:CheY-like chemotaxis protein
MPMPSARQRAASFGRGGQKRTLLINGRPCRALVVDDHPTNRLVLQVMLTEAGAKVTEAQDGQQACEAFATASFDVILMDIQMPHVDGLTATSVIRALEIERSMARTPIIVVSAFVSPSDVRASLAAGADLHLGKPVQMQGLLAAVEDALCGFSGRETGQVAFYYQ